MHHAEIQFRERVVNSLKELFNKKEVIAELGCGFGFYCNYLKNYATKLYCVDIDKEAIEEAKKELEGDNIIFLNEDAANTSIESGSVDTVLFANSLHDMDRESVAREANRILKENGKVIIIDWEKKETEFGPPMHIRMSKEDYLDLFKDYKLEKEFDAGPYHYGLVLRKA